MKKRTTLGLLMAIAVGFALRSGRAAQSPTSGPWEKPAAALAQQIADILGPGEARLTIENDSSIAPSEVPRIRKLLELDLKSRGVNASGVESASAVRVTLSENARERLWVAEIVEGNRTEVAIVELASAAPAPQQAADGLMLRSQPMLTAKEPLLAALEVSGGLVALEAEQIVLYSRSAGAWQEQDRVSIRQRGVLTRDPRGVLLAAAGDQGFEAWLNGTECSGPSTLAGAASDWPVQCRPSDDPWPIATANSLLGSESQANAAIAGGEDRELRAFYNAARNYFVGVVTPAVGVDLPPFYTAAMVSRPAGSAALLVGGIDGKVQLVENGALWTVAGTRDWGSDFAVLRSGCGAGTQIIASGSGEAAHDSLRAYELPALEAIPASAPLAMDGTVTALWSGPDLKSVFAVVRSAADQYEVDRVTALCN